MPRNIDFGRSDALGQCNVLIRGRWCDRRGGGGGGGREGDGGSRHYACAYLRRKLFARGGKRINVAARAPARAIITVRILPRTRRCFSNNDVAAAVQPRKLPP